jgi:hypothetical protein
MAARNCLGFAPLMSVGGRPAEAQERVLVTVRQLFDQGHRLEVPAGAEVVWADPTSSACGTTGPSTTGNRPCFCGSEEG